MVLAYHIVFTTYGFWLPNDPRGSWSRYIGSRKVLRHGRATKVTTRRSVAHVAHNRQARRAAKGALEHSPVRFTGRQALAVAHGFDRARTEGDYTVHACAILPEHVHLVIGRHQRRIDRIAAHLKGRATQQLSIEKVWLRDECPVWTERFWKVYLNTDDDVDRAVRYTYNNPRKENKPRQAWSFVTPYHPFI